jgi:hypothetical protein
VRDKFVTKWLLSQQQQQQQQKITTSFHQMQRQIIDPQKRGLALEVSDVVYA